MVSKTIVITGTSRGIGKALKEKLESDDVEPKVKMATTDDESEEE